MPEQLPLDPKLPVARLTGAQSLVRSLEAVGVEVVFGYPGGTILPSYDPLMDSPYVQHILVRHEQGAGHAAEGYAQATGKVGVCMATSGPGATNLVTPIADAYMDSVPLVAITGQVGTKAIGTDAFQEADITGITIPITKHNYLVTDPAEIPRTIAEAFHLASTGRPGPVLVDIPKSVQTATTSYAWPETVDLPGYRPVVRPHSKQIREAARLIAASERPVLYVGGASSRPTPRPSCWPWPTSPASRPSRRSWPAARCPTRTRTTWACPGCTGRSRPSRPCRRPTCSSRSAPASTTASRGSSRASPRRPRSSTPTSTRPRSARTARSTCRSWATPSWSSPS